MAPQGRGESCIKTLTKAREPVKAMSGCAVRSNHTCGRAGKYRMAPLRGRPGAPDLFAARRVATLHRHVTTANGAALSGRLGWQQRILRTLPCRPAINGLKSAPATGR